MTPKEAFNAWWEENHEFVSQPQNIGLSRKFTAYKAWEAGIQFVVDAISSGKTELDFKTVMHDEFMQSCFEGLEKIREERKGKIDQLRADTLKSLSEIRREGSESVMSESHQIEPAASMQDDSQRMMAIGQNGNTAESYGKGCDRKLKEGQWFNYCGETDMGQTLPALCKCCGGEYELAT